MASEREKELIDAIRQLIEIGNKASASLWLVREERSQALRTSWFMTVRHAERVIDGKKINT